MSEGIQYDVSAVLKVGGVATFENELERAGRAADGLDDSLAKMSRGARQAFDGFAGIATTAAKAFAGIATVGIGAGGMALHEIGKNLSMLEDKSIQLTGVVAASTEQEYSKVAAATRELFEGFKKDAVTSAGETSDFVDTASKIAAPILGAGKSMAELREITKGVIATAPALGVEFKQAGSDVMRMLQGSAGADLPFFQALKAIPSLGLESAEAFNKLSPEKRIETIKKALTNPAFVAASDAMGNTWTGLLSTMQDQLKNLGGLLAGPTFGMAQDIFKNVSGWLTSKLDSSSLRNDIESLGNTIAKRFGEMGKQLRRIFPDVGIDAESTFRTIARYVDTGLGKVVSATKWVADHWGEISSGARTAANAISDAATFAADLLKTVGGGDMVKGLERVAQAFLAVQAAQVAAPIVGGAVTMGRGAWGMGKVLAGGAEAAGTAGAAAVAGKAAAGAGGVGAGATAMALGAFAAAVVGVGLAADQANKYLKETKGFLNPFSAQKNDEMQAIGTAFDEFGHGKRQMGDEEMNRLRQKYVDLAADIGENSAVAGQYVDSMIAMHMDAVRQTNAMKEEVDKAQEGFDVYTIADVYNRAVANNNTAAAKYAAAALLAGDQSAKALEQAGHALVGGYETFSQMIGDSSGASMKKLMEFFKEGKDGPGGVDKKAKTPNAASGGGTLKVELKVNLGEGNEEALYLRQGRDFINSIKGANAVARSTSPLGGLGR